LLLAKRFLTKGAEYSWLKNKRRSQSNLLAAPLPLYPEYQLFPIRRQNSLEGEANRGEGKGKRGKGSENGGLGKKKEKR
jgi:hypothetical protein